MSKKRSLPRAEDIYRHFKGGLYQVITTALHTETGEPLVVYRALYGGFKTFARPLSMFLEEVDKKKYPETKDTYRFTKVEFVPSGSKQEPSKPLDNTSSNNISIEQETHKDPIVDKSENEISIEAKKENDSSLNDENKAMKLFMEFLDESSFDKKRNILKTISPIATSHIINSMAASLDLVPSGVSKEEDLKMISDYISARIHFDGSRLR